MAKPKQEKIQQLELFPDAVPNVTNAVVDPFTIKGEMHGSEPGADLVDSVRQLGVLLPIIVQADIEGGLTIVDGRRRLKAARKLELTEVPVRIIPHGAVDHAETITIQANTARKSNPVSEYIAIKGLIDKGFSPAQISKTLGVKSAVVTARLGLGKLIPALFDLLETGRVAVGVGEALAKVSEPVQEKLLVKFAEEDRLTLRDVASAKRVVKAESMGGIADALFGGDGDKKASDVRTAIQHLDAAQKLLTAHGFQVDFDALRSEVGGNSS